MRLPAKPKSMKDLNRWVEQVTDYLRAITITSVYGGKLNRSSSGTGIQVNAVTGSSVSRSQQVPFWTTLRDGVDAETEEPTLLLSMVPGYVITRRNDDDSAGIIEVTNIPVDEVVTIGDKVMCKVDIDENGIATAAEIIIDPSWQISLAPVLAGGDTSGTAGYRYIRIAEIVQETGERPKSKRLNTGHIDHFQNSFIDNLGAGYTLGEGGQVMARYSGGKWQLRGLSSPYGQIQITEAADEIEIRGNGVSGSNDAMVVDDGLVTEVKAFSADDFNHPWKVTDGGSGNAAIAAGYINGYYFTYSGADPGVSPGAVTSTVPDSIVKAPMSIYGGGTQSITGTQFIYAETLRNGPNLEYTESEGSADVLVLTELYDDISAETWVDGAPTDTVTIVASTSSPSAYTPTSGKAAICIAKVVNSGGVLTITQYLTHNPDLFVPVVVNTCANAA